MLGHDFGVDVTIGAVSKPGQFDPKTVQFLEGQVVIQKGEDLSVFVQRGVFTALAQGVACTVDGTTYTVIDWDHEDASTTRIRLATG